MRTKQINVSIAKDALDTWATFDDNCKALGLSRSEVLTELITAYNADRESCPPHWSDSMCEHSANEPELPDFLR